jgi:protocatechuate 3,4-dioxygenase beta subunit
MRTTFLLAVLVLSGSSTLRSDCKCARPDKEETTRWGGNEMVVTVEKSSFKQLRGVITEPSGSPFGGAFVEVFTHPEYLLSDLPNSHRDRPEQQRVGACITSMNGRFCFRHLQPGAYELRSSISSGWDVTHVHVTVDPKKGKSERIVVAMHIGT